MALIPISLFSFPSYLLAEEVSNYPV